jgi:hypothetical protein
MDNKKETTGILALSDSDSIQKGVAAAKRKNFPGFSIRKRKRSHTVDPSLIVRVTGKISVILVFKASEVTLTEVFHEIRRMRRTKDFRCLHTAFHGTGKKKFRSLAFLMKDSVAELCKTSGSFRKKRLIRGADVPSLKIAWRLSVPDQNYVHGFTFIIHDFWPFLQ